MTLCAQGQWVQGMAQGSSPLRVSPSLSVPRTPWLSCTHPGRGWCGLVGAGGGWRSLGSSSQAPAAVFSRVKVRCFEIFYFELQSWRSGAAPDPRVSVQSRAGSRAGRVWGGCCPQGNVAAPRSSPHSCPCGHSHLGLCQSLFPRSPISHSHLPPREDSLSATRMSFLLSLP